MNEVTTILRIAAGGDGVGKLADGRTVFVPRSAPGDRVELEDVRLGDRFARATVGRILEAGPDRVAPRCRHYDGDRCGGCQLQHLSHPAQTRARRAVVGDALRRIGKLALDDPPLVEAEDSWGYRTKIALAVGPDGRAGFHRIDAPDRTFELVRCEIARDELNQLWAVVQAARAHWPSGLSRLTLRLDPDGGRHLVLRYDGNPPWQGAAAVSGLAAAAAIPLTVWHEQPNGEAWPVAGLAREAGAATAFEQVNPAMGAAARGWAIEQLGALAGRLVWDLYAGTGATSALVAERGGRVESVERDAEAVAAAVRRIGANPAVRFHSGLVEKVVPKLPAPDLVITNPPRIGMAKDAIGAVARVGPKRLVYISCDPATLARDLARLRDAAPRFEVTRVQSFDLFPQTAHVETVAVVERP